MPLVDGSFSYRLGGPLTWEGYKPLYSGHRHRHTRNFTAITNQAGSLLWASGGCVGSTDDLTALAGFEAAGPLADSEVIVIADKASGGIVARLGLAGAITPRHRKDRPSPSERLAGAEADFNTEVATRGVHVEQTIRRLKVRCILHGYRLCARRFDQTISTIAGLTIPAHLITPTSRTLANTPLPLCRAILIHLAKAPRSTS